MALERLASAASGVAASVQSGKLPGAFSGLLLLALLCYSLWVYVAPLLKSGDRDFLRALAALLAITALKVAMLPFFDGYRNDVASYESWALQMAAGGPARIYHAGYFLDYPPGFLYALWLAGAIASALRAGGTALRMIVEAPAMVADFALAGLTFAIVRRIGPSRRVAAYVATVLVALNPALLYDTVVWGQSDSVLALVVALSMAMALDGEFELAWGLATLGVLVKPQALMFVPVLGLWTLLKAPYARWWRAVLSAVVVATIGVMPFGHSWYWILELYRSTAAYYHETSVNAFNLMALLGGLRKPDSDALAGISLFTFGMSLLVPLYVFVGWRLWRDRTSHGLMFATFAALFGFFMFAPRMHERYLYAGLAFAAPLAVESMEMAAVFAIVTATGLFNLAYVLHTLNTTVFLDSRDSLAMAASAINVAALVLAADYGFARSDGSGPLWRKMASLAARFGPQWPIRGEGGAAVTSVEPAPQPLITIEWLRADTIVLAALVAVAAATRLWRLGHPAEIVFDEVHFVAQARHYIRSEPFLDPHPPLAKLVIAAGILLFGDHPWSWRIGNAVFGILLVALTYGLGRRMFASRLAGALGASFVICDGMFLVDSRIAVIDIVYLTFAAWSYLLLFRFAETADRRDRRRTLLAMGATLGLCLGSKLYVPAAAFLLCAGFMLYFVVRADRAVAASERYRRAAGALLMVGASSAALYIVTFLPHFALGWWSGIEDLVHYYGDVMWYERSVRDATHPYSSHWWTWPFLLRPIAYWQNFPPKGKVATIWGGGNPLLWWSAFTAITITAVRALERRKPAHVFLVIGYILYLIIWIPIGRTQFLYHYMPSVYLGYLALGAIVADMWSSDAEAWECVALLGTMVPVFVLGLGWTVGLIATAALFAAYIVAALERPQWAPRFVALAFLATAGALFIYYFPVWTAIPIQRAGYYARMWLQGPGPHNWI